MQGHCNFPCPVFSVTGASCDFTLVAPSRPSVVPIDSRCPYSGSGTSVRANCGRKRGGRLSCAWQSSAGTGFRCSKKSAGLWQLPRKTLGSLVRPLLIIFALFLARKKPTPGMPQHSVQLARCPCPHSSSKCVMLSRHCHCPAHDRKRNRVCVVVFQELKRLWPSPFLPPSARCGFIFDT
jgi:hypothetical protein